MSLPSLEAMYMYAQGVKRVPLDLTWKSSGLEGLVRSFLCAAHVNIAVLFDSCCFKFGSVSASNVRLSVVAVVRRLALTCGRTVLLHFTVLCCPQDSLPAQALKSAACD